MTTNSTRRVISPAVALALCAVLGACGNGADDAGSGPKSFPTPEAATTALVAALQADDDAALHECHEACTGDGKGRRTAFAAGIQDEGYLHLI